MQTRRQLVEKWAPLLNEKSLPEIKDNYRKGVVAQLLENQRGSQSDTAEILNETTPAANALGGGTGGLGSLAAADGTHSGGVAGYDPILISMVRRAYPQLIAYDICGVQPMTGPTGLIFALKAKYTSQGGTEALFNEADTTHSGDASGTQSVIGAANDATGEYATDWTSSITTGNAMTTDEAERLGGPNTADDTFNQMAFSIEKTPVVAKSRALKAEYTIEIAQDLKAVHGIEAEAELSTILTTEVLSEINREVVRTIYRTAKRGSQVNVTTAGTFDMDADSNGRWSVEKFKGLMFQIEREANAIAQQTRRGRGNLVICSSDIASALSMAGVLDYTPALEANAGMQIDDASTTFAGILNGKYKVFIDPYAANQSTSQFFCVGYKGASPFDAGFFYCPYIPLQMVRAVDPETFQPKIGFKTRYGMVANPFVELDDGNTGAPNNQLTADKNYYYRLSRVINLM